MLDKLQSINEYIAARNIQSGDLIDGGVEFYVCVAFERRWSSEVFITLLSSNGAESFLFGSEYPFHVICRSN